MKQYRIFLIFVALIFCELSSLGQISLLYDSITICQDGAFDLQKFQEDEVVVPVGYQLIGWKDVTSTIVIPSSSPTIYVLQYKELANPNVILTEELKVFLRSKPKLEITPSSPYKGARQSVCVGDRVKASITLVENADEYYWQHIETGNKYYTKDLDVEANLLNGNLMTFRAIATNQQCADLVQKEVVYAVLDPNSKAHFWLNEQNSSYPVLVQTKMVINKQYCGNTYLSDLISLNQIQLPCRDYQFVCSYTPTYTESADIKLTKFELHWVESDDYTQGKLLDQDSVTYHCYITAEAYFKTCGVTRTYASDTITLNIKQLCEGVFSGFRYRCNERSKQGQFRFCTANLKKITNIEFINKTTPGKYIPDIKIKDSGANSFTSTDKYEDLATPGCPVPIFVNWDDDAPSELYYDVTFTYIGIDDNIRTYTYYNWKATPCVVDDILEYSVSNKQTSFYNLLSCDSYTFSSGEIRSSCYVKGKLSSPSVIKTSICNGSEAVIAFRVNQDSIWKVVWDCVEKPSAQTSMTYVMEHGKHTFSTTKNFSLTNYDKVTFTVSPTENTMYTGTVNGVPFAILVEIKEDRLAVTDTTICLGQSIDLKGLELATNINGVSTWNVSNTVVSPTVDTEYLIYGVGKKKCVDALDYARTDKTIVHVESQLWATSANLIGAKGSIVNLRNGLNTNGKNIVWYDSNNQEINSDTVIVSSEVKTYTAKIKNACGEKTVTIKVSPKADNTACTNGTLLFKEDFGGNEVTDPSISITPVSQCNLNFKSDGNPKGAGNYVIRKFSYPWHNSWYPRLSDHTHPNDTARGYLMQVDGSATAGQFYICQIDNLCAEAELYLSVWGMGSCNSSSWTDASLTLVVKNLANTELGRQNITLEQGEGVWKQHGMPFKMPIGETSIIFSVINNTAAASGNDFMLDDIEVRLCTPPVTASIVPKDTVCVGDNVSIKGSFVNDGTFTEPLEYRWLYSTTGDLTSQTSWTTVGTNSTILDMTSVQSNQSGYYRLAVASAGSIDLENCRAMSDPVHLLVNQCTVLTPLPCPNGTLLFKEDFGGNSQSSPIFSNTPLSQVSGLIFASDGKPADSSGNGRYAIRKNSFGTNQWYFYLSDHTCPNDTSRGYLMQVDAAAQPGQFYSCIIDSLCDGSDLYLSMWGMSSTRTAGWSNSNLKMVVEDTLGNVLADKPLELINQRGYWERFGLSFALPPGQSSIIYKIINNSSTSSGNDFMLDDIEVRLCTPPVTVSIVPKDTVCAGDNISIMGSFVNDGTFTEPLEYRWLYSTTGDLTSQTSWTTVGTNSTILDMTSVQLNQSGYYRLAVASAGSIDLENCRAMSDPVHLVVNQCTHLVTVANDTIVASACDSVIIINLLNNDTYTCVIPQISLLTQPTVLGASVSIQNDSLVYALDSGHAALDSVQYAITCDGVSESAWVYIFVQSNSFITTEIFPNDTVCKGEYLLFSGKLTNGGTLELPVMYQWQKSYNGFEWTSVDSLGWTAFGTGTGNATTMFPTSHVGTTYYRLVIAEGGDYFLDDCFVTSSVIPIYVVQPTVDTLRLSGCGQVEYENTTFVSDSTFIIETQNAGGCTNELLVQITVRPEPLGEQTITDCDSVTYLGITYFHDTDLTERFSATGECDSLFVTHIDVDNCLSGYLVDDLIVNKYDWIVLCNNTKAKKLVPNYEEIHYQWFKDGQKLIGELDDYYTEDRLLFGCFFLRLLIMAEGQAYPFISETLCINHENLTISPNPVTLSQFAVINYDFTEEEKSGLYVQIYNYLGVNITQFEPSSYPIYLPAGLPQGVYYVKVITGTNRLFGVKLIIN